MRRLIDRLLGRRPDPRCGWFGEGIVCAGPPICTVSVQWPCGHSEGAATPTCWAHLDRLLAEGGVSQVAVACPVCGRIGAARVVATDDL